MCELRVSTALALCLMWVLQAHRDSFQNKWKVLSCRWCAEHDDRLAWPCGMHDLYTHAQLKFGTQMLDPKSHIIVI